MKRTDFLNALAVVEPALAGNELIPILTHFWFTGKEVLAFNDAIAMSTEFETDFEGALKGNVLKGMLSKYTNPEVELSVKGDSAILSSKRSKTKMAILPTESFLFEFPEPDEDDLIPVVPEEFVTAIETCLQSLGGHISEPERKGIVVTSEGKKSLNFYSTDSVTLSHAVVSTKKPHPVTGHFNIPEAFCEAALKLMKRKGGHDFKFYVSEEYSLLEMKDGAKLYGRLVDDPSPPKFAEVLKRHLPKNADNLLMDIPKMLPLVLERAYIVLSKSMDPKTTITVEEGKKGSVMKLHAFSENGDVKETMSLKASQPDVSISVDLARLRECEFAKFDKMTVSDSCILFAKGRSNFHLISVLGS